MSETLQEQIYLPTLHSFENENSYSGSMGLLRYYLTPLEDRIHVQIWHGIYCREKSEVEGERDFPQTEEGLNAIRAWLLENREN